MENRDGEADAVAEDATPVSPPVEIQAFEQYPSRFFAAPQREGDHVIPTETGEDLIANSLSSEIWRSHSFTSYRWLMIVLKMMWIAQWFEPANDQTEVELTSITTRNPDYDPRDGQQTIGGQVMVVGSEEDDTANPPATPNEFIIPIIESFPESTSIGDEEGLAENRPPIEFESPNNHDSSILTIDEQNTARLHYYLDPKDVKFWLRLYASFCVPIALMFSLGKPSPLAGSFLKISVVLYVMAVIIHIILSCVYEHLKNPNSSNLNLSHYGYQILKYVCCILCILAFILLLPVFISNISSNTITMPPPPFPSSPQLD